MKANELRLGNLLQTKEGNRLGSVLRIIPNRIQLKMFCSTLSTGLGDIEPIPLTEEWLLKCGAYWEDIISEKDAFVIDIHEELSIGWCGYLFLIISGCIVQINDTNSIYLHQLQNLFYNLKGTELTLNK